MDYYETKNEVIRLSRILNNDTHSGGKQLTDEERWYYKDLLFVMWRELNNFEDGSSVCR